MIVFVIAMVVFIVATYAIVKHELKTCEEQLDAILKRELSQEECKNMVIKLQGTKLTPAEEYKYKISDDTSRDVGDPGAAKLLAPGAK